MLACLIRHAETEVRDEWMAGGVREGDVRLRKGGLTLGRMVRMHRHDRVLRDLKLVGGACAGMSGSPTLKTWTTRR